MDPIIIEEGMNGKPTTLRQYSFILIIGNICMCYKLWSMKPVLTFGRMDAQTNEQLPIRAATINRYGYKNADLQFSTRLIGCHFKCNGQ